MCYNLDIRKDLAEGVGFEPTSRGRTRLADCKSAAIDRAMRPLHMVRVGGFEPPRVQGPTRSQVWPVCQFRHTRVSKGGNALASSFIAAFFYKSISIRSCPFKSSIPDKRSYNGQLRVASISMPATIDQSLGQLGCVHRSVAIFPQGRFHSLNRSHSRIWSFGCRLKNGFPRFIFQQQCGSVSKLPQSLYFSFSASNATVIFFHKTLEIAAKIAIDHVCPPLLAINPSTKCARPAIDPCQTLRN